MPSTVQFITVGGRSCPGPNLMMMVAAFARASRLSWYPSGTTVIICPGMAKSAGRSGVLGPKTSSRSPLRQTVCRRLVPGSGPRSRRMTSGATASGTEAAIRVRRSSGRLTNPLASAHVSDSDEMPSTSTSPASGNGWNDCTQVASTSPLAGRVAASRKYARPEPPIETPNRYVWRPVWNVRRAQPIAAAASRPSSSTESNGPR